MQFFSFEAREAYQNVAASSCRELAGICMESAVILICIFIFVAALLLLTLGLNLRTHLRAARHARSASPPPYASLGFSPSTSHDRLHRSPSNSPSLDPYRVVPSSLDSSLLLKDDHFGHVSQPERSLVSPRPTPPPPSGVGLFGSIQTGLVTSPLPPPPVYVQDPRRGIEDAPRQ
ncbi:hypothetical protein B0H15DRAFT_947089 [Mycena belliarum]|uniref:Uncharacterized protein n=1 Tax=Mycena belliarum TaxID=1033014 RepID=A0AAD6U883_9AGAR|nr:hypothetical protein B0H15DRAFT_947089 [Mycena belliae]